MSACVTVSLKVLCLSIRGVFRHTNEPVVVVVLKPSVPPNLGPVARGGSGGIVKLTGTTLEIQGHLRVLAMWMKLLSVFSVESEVNTDEIDTLNERQ